SRRPSIAIAQAELTLDAFLRLPERKPALQFEDGEVRQKVSPKGTHSVLQTELVELFDQFARPRKLARAFSELRSTFGGRSYVPDVSVYRWDRIPVDDLGQVANDFRTPPDIAIEIVSPQQSVNAFVRRCIRYIELGAHVALLVDPADESVLAFRSGHTPQPLRGADRIDLDDVLPGFQLRVQELFNALRMP
ncbi:MAG: Uma2 family endonuclease, partial [Chloroflexota bacterium]